MKAICTATFAIVFMSSAWAGDTSSSTVCKPDYTGGGTTCTTTSRESAPATPPRQLSPAEERQQREAKDASIRKWEAYCRPTRRVDKEGVTRLQYAHEGCEFGRSEADEVVADATRSVN
jgi:hypothetical protein